MSKHTPGPWAYEDAPLSEGEYTPHGYIHAELDGNSIVTLGEVWGSSETQQANGRLMAAAPELLWLLKACAAQLRYFQEKGIVVGPSYEIAEELIAKVEGK